MKTTNAPHCKECKKKMRPNYREVCTVCGVQTYQHRMSVGGVKGGGIPGENSACDLICSSMSHSPLPEDQLVKSKKVFAGYGYMNNGKFCTRSCAYYWAIAHA